MTPPAILQKLVPLLASDNDGEVVATVHAIRRALKAAGLDLHDLAKHLFAPAASGGHRQRQQQRQQSSHRPEPDPELMRALRRINAALAEGLRLSEWEAGFFADINPRVRAGYTLTAKQREAFDRLAALADVWMSAPGEAA
jgi:hypothetical protein